MAGLVTSSCCAWMGCDPTWGCVRLSFSEFRDDELWCDILLGFQDLVPGFNLWILYCTVWLVHCMIVLYNLCTVLLYCMTCVLYDCTVWLVYCTIVLYDLCTVLLSCMTWMIWIICLIFLSGPYCYGIIQILCYQMVCFTNYNNFIENINVKSIFLILNIIITITLVNVWNKLYITKTRQPIEEHTAAQTISLVSIDNCTVHSGTVPDSTMYFKGVSCPTVPWLTWLLGTTTPD